LRPYCLRTALRALALVALPACQPEPTGPVSVPLAQAASIRIFTVQTNSDWSSHIPLTVGYAVRLKVRLYTASDREIATQPHPLEMSFTFAPASLATATMADSALLMFDIAPVDTAGTNGRLTITLKEPATATTRSFGPFDVLVHP
jgi:hypothetical protein